MKNDTLLSLRLCTQSALQYYILPGTRFIFIGLDPEVPCADLYVISDHEVSLEEKQSYGEGSHEVTDSEFYQAKYVDMHFIHDHRPLKDVKQPGILVFARYEAGSDTTGADEAINQGIDQSYFNAPEIHNAHLRIAAQRALLFSIIPSTRFIWVMIDHVKVIKMLVVSDKALSQKEETIYLDALTRLTANFSREQYTGQVVEFITAAGEYDVRREGRLVYARWEDLEENETL